MSGQDKPVKSLEERKVEALEKIANQNPSSGRYAIALAIYFGLVLSSCLGPNKARAGELEAASPSMSGAPSTQGYKAPSLPKLVV